MKKSPLCMAALLALAAICHASPVRDLQRELGINDSEWKVADENDTHITWLTTTEEAVTLMIVQGKSELTNPDDAKGMQAVFRDEAKKFKGGLVEVQTFVSGGVKCGLVTMKFLADGVDPAAHGYAYQLNAIIPVKDRAYVIQVAATEGQPTGVREATVAAVLMTKAGKNDSEKAVKDFRRDPYDAKYNADALYMISDDRKWDDAIPVHPLTRARKLMDTLIKNLKMPGSIKDEALFKK